jgi:cell division transport system permease protein
MSEEKSRSRIQSSSVTTVISVSLVLFLMGLLGIFLISAKKISDYYHEHIGFHVYIKNNSSEDETERLQNFLNASSFVKSSSFLSKDSAAANYEKVIGEDFVKFIGYNPLRNSYEVGLKAEYANPDSIKWIKKQITDFTCVEEFNYEESLVDWVNKNVKIIAICLLTLIALLLLIALALINSTIRLAIYSKRFVVRTMQLVGATGGFIRKPFLITATLQGVLSGLIANMLIVAFVYLMLRIIPDLKVITDMLMMVYLFIAVLVVGVLISGISTFFAVRKYLGLNSDKLYY